MKTNFDLSKVLFLGIIFISSITSRANAQDSKGGLFVEPAITYELGNSSINYPSPLSSSSGRPEGFGLGARLGFHVNEAFFLGADFRYAIPHFKDTTNNYDANADSSNWGLVAGIQMPDLGMRVWGSYILDGALNPDQSNGLDVKFTNATGFRVGAGFRISVVSMNLEYQQTKYGKTNLEQIGPFSTNTSFDSVNLENKTWIVSVSFPMEF